MVFVDINERARYNEQQQQDAPSLLLCIFPMSPYLMVT